VVQVAGEVLVCSVRDDKVGAQKDLSRDIAFNSEGVVLPSHRTQSEWAEQGGSNRVR